MPASVARINPRNMVNSLAKGLRVLESFTAENPEVTLSEVARKADLDPGTTFRMLNTLHALGYIEKVEGSRTFRLALKVTDLGFHAIGRMDLRDIARPVLRQLVNEISEAASLGVLDQADILYIERVRAGLTRLGVDIRIGTTIPAYCSAIGASILAFSPPSVVERVLQQVPRSSHRPLSTMSKTDIAAMLLAVRTAGYALAESQISSGLRILAAPVLDQDGIAIAAISVAAPSFHATEKEFVERSLEPLRHATRQIASALRVSGVAASSVA